MQAGVTIGMDGEQLVAIIARIGGSAHDPQVQADLQALADEVVRLRGVIYEIRDQWRLGHDADWTVGQLLADELKER